MQRQLILVAGLLLSSCLPAEAQTLATQVFLAQARPAPTTILVWALPIPLPPKASLASQRPRKLVAPPTVLLPPSYEPDQSLESQPLIEPIWTPFITESCLVVVQFWRGHLQLDGIEGTLHMQNPHFGPPGSGPPPGHDQAALASSFNLDGIEVVFHFGRDAQTGRRPQIWRYLASIMKESGGRNPN
jgi:hypothetical protein